MEGRFPLEYQRREYSMIPLDKVENIPGWMEKSALQWLRSVALALPAGAVIVELGCWMGRSTAALAVPHIKLISVDNFQGTPHDTTQFQARQFDVYRAFLSNVIRYNLRLSLLYMDSLKAAELIKDSSVNMIVIDDDHGDFSRILKTWERKVVRGGIVSGHDYSSIRFPNIRYELSRKRIAVNLVSRSSLWFYFK